MNGSQTVGTSVWPVDTDLIYAPGSNKIMLTLQMPLVRTVVQDAFENIRASILFEDAFPDLNLTVLFVRKNLIRAARAHLPRAVDIHRRLIRDDRYLDQLSRLVSGSPSILI